MQVIYLASFSLGNRDSKHCKTERIAANKRVVITCGDVVARLEKRRRLYYAVRDIPLDAQKRIGKSRFFRSTGTGDHAEAAVGDHEHVDVALPHEAVGGLGLVLTFEAHGLPDEAEVDEVGAGAGVAVGGCDRIARREDRSRAGGGHTFGSVPAPTP